ncbi:hypothetical protein AMTR_s00199p00020590 [Amborella trichopoda]|uniref:Uncharacterized protein n=1 Tax=Amborella trichopoda TaxID=13333 RepID=U5D927_AMBTC|nr:hypothetical protein AMTR_s00199p00020590 [Amborella trichopoda]
MPIGDGGDDIVPFVFVDDCVLKETLKGGCLVVGCGILLPNRSEVKCKRVPPCWLRCGGRTQDRLVNKSMEKSFKGDALLIGWDPLLKSKSYRLLLLTTSSLVERGREARHHPWLCYHQLMKFLVDCRSDEFVESNERQRRLKERADKIDKGLGKTKANP